MKVYVATSGEYSDYRIQHVFAHRQDAEAYKGADGVEEYDVHFGPVEMRSWYTLVWNPGLPDRDESDSLRMPNPYESVWMKDYDGRGRHATHHWAGPPMTAGPVLHVEGWDVHRVRKVYSEQRAQYLARQDMAYPERGAD